MGSSPYKFEPGPTLVGKLYPQIRDALWPNETVVEFDHGINVAIRRLRDALVESAGEPRYIETVGRRGYRLFESVEVVEVVPSQLSRTAPPPIAPDTLEGKPISHYLVLEKLGSGGMGVVFRAKENGENAAKSGATGFRMRLRRLILSRRNHRDSNLSERSQDVFLQATHARQHIAIEVTRAGRGLAAKAKLPVFQRRAGGGLDECLRARCGEL